MRKDLTHREVAFVRAYMELGVAAEAYRSAYSSSGSSRTIYARSSEVMRRPRIIDAIRLEQEARAARSEMSKDRLLRDIVAILDANISDYVDVMDGKVLIFKDFKKISRRRLAAIESVKQGANGVELKLHSKAWAVDRICKMLGYDAPQQSEIKSVSEFSAMSDADLLAIAKLPLGDFGDKAVEVGEGEDGD